MKVPATLALVFTALLLPIHSSLSKSPNVIVFLTDDQGWGDLSINGNANLSTPHIDSLAEQGISFENFYVCQVCAPTRAEFLTGRYYPRTGVSGVSTGQERLNPDEKTIANVFKANGYATGAFGKWHNGTQSPYHPNDRGFDEYYGFTSGHWGHYFSPPLDHNGEKVRGNGYVVDDFTDRAIAFIEANKDRPFFCYVPYNTPHSPMMISNRFYDKFEDRDPEMLHRDPQREDPMMTRAALAMCENIDWNVGRVLAALEQNDLERDTIVVFFCDNGPNSYRWNGDMKGRKGAIDEGGLRSPLFIRWPDSIDAGKRVETIAGAIDLLPTLTSLAGLKVESSKPMDGRDLSPLIDGNGSDWAERSLFSIKNEQVSVRNQRFRLDADGALFDIAEDRGQRNDVSRKNPKIKHRLLAQAKAHKDAMMADFERYSSRPYTVGYKTSTTLTARDGVSHGDVRRSVRSPNNSFFTEWTSEGASLTWDISVRDAGRYEAIVYHTCTRGNEGLTLKIAMEGAGTTTAKVRAAFDPPLYDKSLERVAESHYYVKEFKPLSLGKIELRSGRGLLSLTASDLQGPQAIDVHSIELIRQ